MRKFAILVAFGVLLVPASASAALLSLGLSGNIGSKISFDGSNDSFEFTNDFGFADFIVTSVVDLNDPSYTSGLAPTGAIGLSGEIDGTFTIETANGTADRAPVSGIGTFRIVDSFGVAFLADLSWTDISTNGAIAGTNTSATVNLSNFQYAGSNPDLVEITRHAGGVITSSFQFSAPVTLAELTADDYTGSSSGWSASVVTAPEPGTLFLAGLGLAGLGSMAARRRSKKSSAA